MFRESRRRFLAGFAAMGVGGALLGRAAMAQQASSIQCQGALTNKAVTGLKPMSAEGGVYQSLAAGKLTRDADQFGQRSEFKILGKIGKLAKGVTVAPNDQSTLNIRYTRAEVRGYENLYINIDLASFMLGNLYDAYFGKASLAIPALKGLSQSTFMNPNSSSKSVRPTASTSFSSPWGEMRTKVPKSGDFTAKIMVDGKAIAEIKFPKVELNKIIDALNKEHRASADKLAKDPALAGDLTFATMPAGCTVTKTQPGRTGCFLTTASTREIGLSDDCWELTQLHILGNRLIRAGGKPARLMLEYYRKAPAVVDRINARADARKIWLRFYWSCIVPSALAVQLRLDGLAGRIYVRGSRKLQLLAACP